MRRCSKCLAEKPLPEFKTDKRKPLGVSSCCRACSQAACRKYRETHVAPRIIKQKNLKRRPKAAARRVPQEKQREYQRQWAKNNPTKVRAIERNKRAKKKEAVGKHTGADVKAILAKQKHRCAYCTKSLRSRYHIDHIMPIARDGSNDRRNLQALCPTCNTKKWAKHPLDYAREIGLLL